VSDNGDSCNKQSSDVYATVTRTEQQYRGKGARRQCLRVRCSCAPVVKPSELLWSCLLRIKSEIGDGAHAHALHAKADAVGNMYGGEVVRHTKHTRQGR
jgi:hypothetical protein